MASIDHNVLKSNPTGADTRMNGMTYLLMPMSPCIAGAPLLI